jgi:hypothetical protein
VIVVAGLLVVAIVGRRFLVFVLGFLVSAAAIELRRTRRGDVTYSSSSSLSSEGSASSSLSSSRVARVRLVVAMFGGEGGEMSWEREIKVVVGALFRLDARGGAQLPLLVYHSACT